MVNALNLTEIMPGLYVGGMQLVYDADALRQAQITRILKLYFTFELRLVEETLNAGAPGKHVKDAPEWPSDFVVLDMPLEFDAEVSSDAILDGVNFLKEQLAAGKSVAVICNAGVSRSSALVLAYLVSQGQSLYDAWQFLRSRYPFARPTMQQWMSLLEHYHLPYTATDITEWQSDI